MCPAHLPIPPHPILGRDRETEEVLALLARDDIRLVSVTGPPGVGKTRLGLEVARRAVSVFPDGVWFVSLAPIRDPSLVSATIAAALGITALGDQPALDAITTHLRHRECLVLLDNFEHLTQVASPEVAELLASCPGPKVLVTTRSLLRVSGEFRYPLDPLPVPPAAGGTTGQEAATYPAVQLFAERVHAATGQFAVDESNAAVATAICARLDGLPLAIELAAARVRHMPLPTLLEGLEQRLPLLSGGVRNHSPRQQTMHGAIDWSHDLLEGAQQALFRRLSVFAGGWTLESALAVTAMYPPLDGNLLDLHSSLIDESLVRHAPYGPGGSPPVARYEMLETLREYGAVQLLLAGENAAIERRHTDAFLAFLKEANRGLAGKEQPAWLARLVAEQDNLRAALERAITGREAETALRMASGLWRFWAHRGLLTEGRVWLERALAIGADAAPALRQDALHHLGNILIDLDEFRPARTCFEEGLAICAHLGDEDGMAAELTGLGLVSRYLGDYDRSFAQFQRCLEIWTRHGSTWKTGITLHNLGNLEISRGAFEAADRFHAEALLLRRELGDAEGEAYSLFGLGAANFYLRQYADAADLYATSLRLFLEVGDAQGEAHARHGLGRVEHALGNDHLAAEHLRLALALRYEFRSRLGVAECLDLLAAIAARRDRHDRAARLIGAAVAIHDAIRWVEPDADRVARERVLAAIRRALGHQKSAAAVRDGKALPLSRAVGEALSLAVEAEAIPTAASAFGLTSRQVEVLRLLSQRLTDPEIAEALFVSPRTASFHVTSILRKLGVDNRREAAVLAAQHGLI